MLKASELIHRQLLTRDAGERVGKVHDLVVDQKGSQVLGVLVEEGFFGGAHVVRWPAILSVGEDTLIIDSKTSIVKASEVPEMKDVFDRGNVLAGVQIRTTEGLDLGKFEAFYFDEKSGSILGYELSGGAGRKKRARSFLPTPASFEAGKDVAFVSPEVADTLQDLEEALKQSQSPTPESTG
jgi:uncharacterized protein YrrD